MRIQHNIMAMNAYRNYSNNVSAMQKNLEKLSSGYKINRAGDDAAGLAISEKMRAQISGLEAAQKNAKDGISLVQTAEGALTEVHDMLNRMVTLATQSANGTYADDTDREQLQKEINQLTDEINRIADSSNFNGIKLLDGSMDGSDIPGAVTNVLKGGSDATTSLLPGVGATLGVNTVLHSGEATAKTAQFGISLHNVTYSNDDATGSMTIKFGNDAIKISGGGSAAVLTANGLVTSLTNDNPRTMAVGTQEYQVEGTTLDEQLTSWVNQFNNDGTANSAGKIQAAVKGSTIEFTATAAAAGTAGNTLTVGGNTLAGGVDAEAQVNTVAVTFAKPTDDTTITIDGTTYRFHSNDTSKIQAGETGVDISAWNADGSDSAKWITEKLVNAGAFEITGFDSPADTGGTVSSFDLTATNAEAATTTNKLGASDTKDAIDAKITALVTAGTAPTVAVTQKTAGVDEVAASYNSGAMLRLNPTLEVAGFSMTPTKTDPTEMVNEFIDAYNQANSNFKAEWNDTNDGIKFTATNNGEVLGGVTSMGIANASGFQFQATGVDGGASTLGREGTLNAEQILNAIMTGKAEISTNGGTSFSALGMDKINGSITLSDGAKYKMTAEGDTLTFTQLENDVDGDGAFNPTTLDRQVTINSSVNANTGKNMHAGDYQKSTTFNTPSDDVAANRLASTFFTTDGTKVKDKASMFIGGKNYQFTTDADAAKADSTKVYIGDLVDEEGNINPADTATMTKINERITVAAKDNEVYTVGYDQGRLTFTEKVGYTTGSQEYDLTKLSEIERSLGYAEADTPNENGKGLVLQIGDTAESFNQLTVNIRDMHATSLGLDGIDISTQDGALKAVNKIKDAINLVSDVRGTLGATQNRLDHTINNLSVMTENIQDAESTIRDVDVAEEMMAYTKNSILIQSAQAMLAQANQVPQGVLQLLG